MPAPKIRPKIRAIADKLGRRKLSSLQRQLDELQRSRKWSVLVAESANRVCKKHNLAMTFSKREVESIIDSNEAQMGGNVRNARSRGLVGLMRRASASPEARKRLKRMRKKGG